MFEFAHDVWKFSCCVCNVFYAFVPLGVAAESYAQMFVVFNKLYNGIIKNKRMKSLNILKSI